MGLRVLHVMSCRGWSSDAYWAGRIACELELGGHRVTFVARAGTEDKVLHRLEALGVRDIVTLRFGGRRAPLGLARDLSTLRYWMAQHDIVHVHRGKEHWLAALANALLQHPVPLFRTRHIVHPVRNHPANRWLYDRTARVIAVSRCIQDCYVGAGLVPPDRVTTLRGGVDDRTFRPDIDPSRFLATHGLAPGTRVVGVLAGLRVMKGHTVFIDAARLVLADHPQVRFIIAGDGPQLDAIRRRICELELQGAVVTPGFVPDPERVLAAFDVAVYPSLSSEGMGRVLFEYMATGRAIVATRVGLAPEVLNDETAWLVDAGDPRALAQAINAALASPERAAQAGRVCRRLVESCYSGAVVARAIGRLYSEALDRGLVGSARP